MGNGSCCKFKRRRLQSVDAKSFEPLLQQEEKEAVNNLLKYYDEENFQLINLSRDQLKALTVLSYSDNDELQRTAAFFFSEISEQYTQEVSEVILQPLIHLLTSLDNEVLRAASLALSSLALYGPEENKAVIVKSGGLPPLIKLLRSDQVEVLCNVCGCLTTLATQEQNKIEIVKLGALRPLIRLTRARDIRVKRNSAGALLNLSHVAANRVSIVGEGGVPYLVQLLDSQDEDIQFYCSATLSNVAVDGGHRSVIMNSNNGKVLSSLIKLIQNGTEKVKSQACLALRNLASDEAYQGKIFQAGALDVIYELLTNLPNHNVETVVAATAALKNISIHQGSEVGIVNKKLVPVLCSLLKQDQYVEVRCHAAGTIRNVISVQQAVQALVMAGGINLLLKIVTTSQNDALLAECSAAMAIAASHAEVGHMILESNQFTKILASLADYSTEVVHNLVGVLGHLSANAANHEKLLSHDPSLLIVVSMVTKMNNPDGTSCNFLCLWILAQLSIGSSQTKAALQHHLNKDSALNEWVCQQQSTASGDSRQLAAMVMGMTSSSSLLTSLSESLTTSQKLPCDPSVLKGFENERTKGNSLLRKGYFNDAVSHYTRCIELCPSMPSSYTNRALCYLRMGRYGLAEKDCTTSLLLDPTNVKVLLNRSLARKRLSRYDDALKDLDALLKLDPNNSEAIREHELLGQIQEEDERRSIVDL